MDNNIRSIFVCAFIFLSGCNYKSHKKCENSQILTVRPTLVIDSILILKSKDEQYWRFYMSNVSKKQISFLYDSVCTVDGKRFPRPDGLFYNKKELRVQRFLIYDSINNFSIWSYVRTRKCQDTINNIINYCYFSKSNHLKTEAHSVPNDSEHILNPKCSLTLELITSNDTIEYTLPLKDAKFIER